MNQEDQAEIDAIQAAMTTLLEKQPELTGDTLLNAATERAGYVVGVSCVEQCANCRALYHTDYGGEYIDPFDCDDLRRELRIRGMKKLYYMHFCGFVCLRRKAYDFYTPRP